MKYQSSTGTIERQDGGKVTLLGCPDKEKRMKELCEGVLNVGT